VLAKPSTFSSFVFFSFWACCMPQKRKSKKVKKENGDTDGKSTLPKGKGQIRDRDGQAGNEGGKKQISGQKIDDETFTNVVIAINMVAVVMVLTREVRRLRFLVLQAVLVLISMHLHIPPDLIWRLAARSDEWHLFRSESYER
jgi:hypothetical protein